MDGVHTMDFSSFECSASFVKWKDYDYPWSSSDFLLARETHCHGCHHPVTSSHAYPWRQDIIQFENPTHPPFLRGGQRPWRGHSYSPSELRYVPPHAILCLRCSQSHSPTSCHHMPLPVMGTRVAQSWSRTRSRSGSHSSGCSGSPSPMHPQCPVMPALNATSPGILCPSSHSMFTPIGQHSPPLPFFTASRGSGWRKRLLSKRSVLSLALSVTSTQ